jgi:hypothetical protein
MINTIFGAALVTNELPACGCVCSCDTHSSSYSQGYIAGCLAGGAAQV